MVTQNAENDNALMLLSVQHITFIRRVKMRFS